MGFDDEWFRTRSVKYEPAGDMKELFFTKGFKRVKKVSKKRGHAPTDAGHCIRKRVFQFLGAPESNGPGFGAQMVFEMGDKLGQSMVVLAQRAGIYIDDEQQVHIQEDGLDYPFSGRADLVIDDPFFTTHMGLVTDKEGNSIPVEFKTIKANGFDDMKGVYKGGPKVGQEWVSLGAMSQPKKDHIMQIHHYMKDMGAPYGYIAYLNKNDQRMSFHRVWWNPMVWDDIVNEALVVEEYLRNGIVPKRSVTGHRGSIQFYQRRTGDAEPGDINWNEGKFPCMWKGKDGGEAGCCSLLHLCYRDTIMENGSEKEKAIVKQFNWFKYTEGALDVDISRLRSYAEDDAPDATDEPVPTTSPAQRDRPTAE